MTDETTPSAEELWRDICEKDDCTSPEEYPDMVLINFDEFNAVLTIFAAAAVAKERQRVIEILHEEGWLGRSERRIAHPSEVEVGPRIPSPDETPAAPEMREALTLHSLAKGQAPEAISAIEAMERAATAKRLSLGVLCRDWHDERGKDWIVYDPKAPVGTTVAAGPFKTQAEAHAALEQIVQAAALAAYWSHIMNP